MFGLEIGGDRRRYWGARATFKGEPDGYHIDILWDKLSSEGFDSTIDPAGDAEFLKWLNRVAVPWLRGEVKSRRMDVSSSEELLFRDGRYELRASTKDSYGYLFIGAVEHYAEHGYAEMLEQHRLIMLQVLSRSAPTKLFIESEEKNAGIRF